MQSCPCNSNYALKQEKSQFNSVYDYVPPPNMPGVRDLSDHKYPTVRVRGLNKVGRSYPTARKIKVPGSKRRSAYDDLYNELETIYCNNRYTGYPDLVGRGPTGRGIPDGRPIEGFGFGIASESLLFRLLILVGIIAIIYYAFFR